MLIENVAFCRYKAAEAGLLLTVERNTLISGKGATVAGGTLSSSASPTLGAMVLGGRFGLMMACRLWIAVLRFLAALMAVIGMVLCNVQSTLHTAKTVRSVVEIVCLMQWLGYSHHVSAMQHHWVVGM